MGYSTESALDKIRQELLAEYQYLIHITPPYEDEPPVFEDEVTCGVEIVNAKLRIAVLEERKNKAQSYLRLEGFLRSGIDTATEEVKRLDKERSADMLLNGIDYLADRSSQVGKIKAYFEVIAFLMEDD